MSSVIIRPFSLLCFLSIILFSTASSLQSQPGNFSVNGTNPAQPGTVQVPEDVQSDGSYRHFVAFELPAYRGLVPNIGLSYSSTFKGLGSAATWLSTGWQLTGLSSIDRVSIGGGVPSYDDMRDIYRLDGMELMACDDCAAVTPYTDPYPDEYKTDVSSASCQANGNMVTYVNNFKRINKKTKNSNGRIIPYFEVRDRTGTVYTYRSLGDLSGDTIGTNDPHFDILFHRKFLLSQVRDLQSTPNVVNISYDFDLRTRARAHRPKEISYAGYKVRFLYGSLVKPLATYAVGSPDAMGDQRYLLRGVAIYNQNTPIRAYRMAYHLSPTIGRRVLDYVRQYGSDFTEDGTDITGGSALPKMIKDAVYNSDAVQLTTRTFVGKPIHSNLLITDTDRDNRDEILLLDSVGAGPRYMYVEEDHGSDPPTYLSSVGLYRKDNCHPVEWAAGAYASTGQAPSSVDLSNINLGEFPFGPNPTPHRPDAAINPQVNTRTFSGLLYFSPKTGNTFTFADRHYEEVWTEGHGSDTETRTRDVYPTYVLGLSPINTTGGAAGALWQKYSGAQAANPFQYQPGSRGRIVGNFDSDPEPEVAVPLLKYPNSPQLKALIYEFHDIDTNGSSITTTFSFSFETDYGIAAKGDFDGDGAQEWLMQNDSGTLFYADINGESTQPVNLGMTLRANLAAADVNGDGADDLIVVNGSGASGIQFAISHGSGFGPLETIGDVSSSAKIADLYSRSQAQGFGRISIADINADGYQDIVVHQGYETHYCSVIGVVSTAFSSQKAFTFLSSGDGFLDNVVDEYSGFVGLGDIDGNGLTDYVFEGENDGQVLLGDGQVANLLTSFTDDRGGKITVEYSPSTYAGTDNRVPSVSQVVKSVTRENRPAQTGTPPAHLANQPRTTRYSYSGSRYDYVHRRPLGYKEVVAILPLTGGEANAPTIETTYGVEHLYQRGNVLTQAVNQNGTTYSQVINTYAENADASDKKGPFFQVLSQTRNRTLQGASLLETRKDYVFSQYGVPLSIKDRGFIESGSDPASLDNSTTIYWYSSNLDDYVVALPYVRRIEKGINSSSNRNRWLFYEDFNYDGQAKRADPPISGNVTRHRVWSGNLTGNEILDRMEIRTYDGFGNILTSKDARNNTTTYTYDAGKNLFEETVTNAKGQVVTNTWNKGCQVPTRVKDVNDNNTDYVYDTFCREINVDYPNGGFLATSYINFGNPETQYVRTRTASGGTASLEDETRTYDYFDGFGDTYRLAVSGKTTDVDDLSAVVLDFDQRGRLAWESVPLTWSESFATIPGNRKVLHAYDPLDRELQITFADGDYSTWQYDQTQINVQPNLNLTAQDVVLPVIVSRNPDCFDGDDSTVCILKKDAYDSRGNHVAEILIDVDGTDHGSSPGETRKNQYYYNQIDELEKVRAQGGHEWSFTYDFRGNRLTSDDPSFGLWSMTYDLTNNLTQQTDAKGQTIGFEYDSLNRVTKKTVDWVDENGDSQSQATNSYYDQNNSGLAGGENVGQLTKVEIPGHHEIRYGYTSSGLVAEERHKTFTGGTRTYSILYSYNAADSLSQVTLPVGNNQSGVSFGPFDYDAAGRLKTLGSWITNSTYNVRDQLTERNYGSGGVETWDYDPRRGWVTRHKYALGGTVLNRTQYTRQASGKVSRQNELRALGNYDYCYDYAGRVLVAANLNAAGETCATVDSWTPSKNNDQSFTYLKDGSIKTNTLHNGHDLTYNYNSSMAYAPVTVSPASGSNQSLAYDANGNMTQALDGKTIVYDGENRPTSVTLGGVVTRYEYGADGQRLYRIDDAGAANAAVTLYLPNMEVRDLGATETRIAYPHPNLRVVNGIASYLLRNQLDSVVLVTDQNGAEDFERVYQPFGNDFNWTLDASAVPDDKGFIGQRRDDDAELIYLNARYLDPTLGMFTQPDWLDVTLPSVGVNRFAYSHNDPVNLADPGGNVPYNPGGDTSTGWTEHENGSETYDSRTDRYSSDYLNSDGDNHHTIGEYNPDFFSEDAYGSRTRTRSHVNSGFYDRDSGYRGAQQDAVRLDGSQNAEYARNTASVAIGAASLATGVGGVVTGTRASLASEPLVAAALARAAHNTKTLQSYMARNQGLITQAKARGGFKQALDHAQRLADFARNPTVRSNMSNMSAAKIRAQQINRALKLEKDMIRNMNQSFGRIFDYLR